MMRFALLACLLAGLLACLQADFDSWIQGSAATDKTALGDEDEDGLENLWEYLYSELSSGETNPVVANVDPRVLASALPSGRLELSMTLPTTLPAGLTVAVEGSQDLTNWTEITDASESVTPMGQLQRHRWMQAAVYGAPGSWAYMRVALNSAGAAPTAPTALSVQSQANGTARLSWSDNSTTESGFTVERQVWVDGRWQKNGQRMMGSDHQQWVPGSWGADTSYQLGAGTQIHTDNGVSTETWYRFRVQAYNGSGSSAWTGWVEAMMRPVNPNGNIYYVDPSTGNDADDGLTEATAWQSLWRASSHNYETTNPEKQSYGPGDWILLRKGETHWGSLYLLDQSGSAAHPIRVGAYKPVASPSSLTPDAYAAINCNNHAYGIYLYDCSDMRFSELEITGNGGPGTQTQRKAIYAVADANISRNMHFDDLYLHDLFSPQETSQGAEGERPTYNPGTGIQFQSWNTSPSYFDTVSITNCRFEHISDHAVYFGKWPEESDITWVDGFAIFERHRNVTITNNHIFEVGGDGFLMASVAEAYVANNSVIHPGIGTEASEDQRYYGRGDGIWVWYTLNVLAEYNHFEGARGRADCYGMHIDIGARNTIFQYNLSLDNEGGFAEMIGNSRNSVYRYNISINDGTRRWDDPSYGRPQSNGRTYFLTNFMAGRTTPEGPYHSYVYNNTIYTSASQMSSWDDESWSGVGTARYHLLMNNLVCLTGNTEGIVSAPGSQFIHARNNRYVVGEAPIPANAFTDYNPADNFAINPQFANAGGTRIADYIPDNQSGIQNQGAWPWLLEGGASPWPADFEFMPATDILGNPIQGTFDIGAIEWQP